ncbi:MAG: prolipoprotein diacylglyceryl transferase [Ruminococcaceae bacterium]|nr:prolipoprotein diacylglyceryl transferase [Oscillospiraceae bacterium]
MMAATTVSFPGIGIGEFTLDRVAFSLFGKDIYWYALIITLGIVVACLYAYYRSRIEGVSADDLIDIALVTILSGIIGARLYYVLTTLDSGDYKSFIDVIAIWNGGLAIYGGIIAGALAILVMCRIKRINVFKVMDCAAPGVMIAQAIGRWGNFVNGEAYGYEVAESNPLYFLRMGLNSQYTGAETLFYHPTFLYESIWNVVGFVLINIFYKKKKFNGQIALMYLAWYGIGRFFIEGLRTDSLYVFGLRISQIVGLVCFVVCTALLVVGFVFERRGKLAGRLGGMLDVVWAEPANKNNTENADSEA